MVRPPLRGRQNDQAPCSFDLPHTGRASANHLSKASPNFRPKLRQLRPDDGNLAASNWKRSPARRQIRQIIAALPDPAFGEHTKTLNPLRGLLVEQMRHEA